MKKKFKVLMFARGFVNEAMLRKGIYFAPIPVLHRGEATMESLVKDWKYILSEISPEVTEGFIANLKQCTLVEVELKIIKNSKK